jgi:hypothetical protein
VVRAPLLAMRYALPRSRDSSCGSGPEDENVRGKEGDRSQNGLNHQPKVALPSDIQSGRPPHIGSSRQGATGPNAVGSLTSEGGAALR